MLGDLARGRVGVGGDEHHALRVGDDLYEDVVLATVRLDALVSQRLGEMCKAIRDVFDYAERHECVLLLDEFDALVRRRDEEHESGELRRVTNIFLQQLDRFEGPGILVAATDRPDLLDAAVWSRFERVLKIPMPTTVELKEYVNRFVQPSMTVPMRSKSYDAFEGMSYAELETATRNARRYVALVEAGGGLRPYHLVREVYELKNHSIDDEVAYVRYLIEAECTLRENIGRTLISMCKIQRVSSVSRDEA